MAIRVRTTQVPLKVNLRQYKCVTFCYVAAYEITLSNITLREKVKTSFILLLRMNFKCYVSA